MAYSEALDERISQITILWDGTKKKMFGGVCHLLGGNMVAGVWRDHLILRLGEQGAARALEEPHVRAFDVTGLPMKGWVMVAPEGYGGEALERWLEQAREFVETLPPK